MKIQNQRIENAWWEMKITRSWTIEGQIKRALRRNDIETHCWINRVTKNTWNWVKLIDWDSYPITWKEEKCYWLEEERTLRALMKERRWFMKKERGRSKEITRNDRERKVEN